MSRFPNWSMADVERLSKAKELAPKKKITKDYPGMIIEALKVYGIECQREYKFLHDRRFRFDFVILPISTKIAIEFDGSIYTQGRHTRPMGFISDCKKMNLAVMHDWKVLRYTTADTKGANWEAKVAAEIFSFIQGAK